MHKIKSDEQAAGAVRLPTYAGRYFDEAIPEFDLPGGGMPAEAAYQLIHDELDLDGQPALNLASFVTTWMEPAADRLAVESRAKNLIDEDEYPQTQRIHERVISMIGRLFNAPSDCEPWGTATIGSSEAIMLALLAHKRSWQRRREAAGEPTDSPNLVIGADVHTCWEKFTRYFDVEMRIAPLAEGRYTLSAQDVEARVDENTIAVGAVLGTTFTGQMDDLAGINELVGKLERDKGWKIPIHVDGASGGFIVPFTKPDLAWDFRLEHVRSINVSNHKFGLVYPGMGTVVFRDRSDLPEELVFHINYLGGDMPNYSLNFSRASAMVVLQYYNFLRLGRAGYERVMSNIMDNARALAQRLTAGGALQTLEDSDTFPIVAVRPTDPERIDVFALSQRLRERGWIVPAYTLPPNAEHIAVLRMVVRESFGREMIEMLADDIEAAIERDGSSPVKPSVDADRKHRPVC